MSPNLKLKTTLLFKTKSPQPLHSTAPPFVVGLNNVSEGIRNREIKTDNQ